MHGTVSMKSVDITWERGAFRGVVFRQSLPVIVISHIYYK